MTGSASGKLILCGEHAVVYGHPAIAMPISQRTTVTLDRVDGPSHFAGPADERATKVLRLLASETGWRATVDSDIPIGRGMGSSAALCVAIVRAMGVSGQEAQIAAAMVGEREFHGNPSGLDVQVSVREAMIRFQRPHKLAILAAAPRWTVVVLDSGFPGNTKKLVAGVAARRPGIDPVLDDIGALVHEAERVLDDAAKLGPMLTENHRLLTRIGVSTPQLDGLVELALTHDAAGAKLSGAGGGGVVLAIIDDPKPLLTAAHQRGITAFAFGDHA